MAGRASISDCSWNQLSVKVNYRCTCGSTVSLMVYKNGQTYSRVDLSPVSPVVDVEWDDVNGVHIRSSHCDSVLEFKRNKTGVVFHFDIV